LETFAELLSTKKPGRHPRSSFLGERVIALDSRGAGDKVLKNLILETNL